MQFKDGTRVYAFDGQHVGRVDRVVLNPETKEVTDIVVRKGFLFTEDKIIPLNLIASATEDRVALRENASQIHKLPLFEETHYVSLDKDEWQNGAYAVGMPSSFYLYPGDFGYDTLAPYRIETVQNIPENTLALKEGVRVISADKQYVGDVVRILTEPSGNRVTAFLISAGAFFAEKKLIPVTWIHEIQEQELYLNVGTAVLDKVHEYQEAL